MDDLDNPQNQNVSGVLPPDYIPSKKFWSIKKLIFISIGVIIIFITLFGSYFGFWSYVYDNSHIFNKSDRATSTKCTSVSDCIDLVDSQGGREANYWEINYLAMSGFMNYPDICNKIYPNAYEITGGGFKGPFGIRYIKPACLAHVGDTTDNWNYNSRGTINPFESMGYPSQDYIQNESEFLTKVANTNDFKSRLSKLPDFSDAKDDTILMAPSLQCKPYFTSYAKGLPGHIPDPAVGSPCCIDLNQDKICDQLQWENRKSISARNIGISMTISGLGFIPDYGGKQMNVNLPFAGYIIKDKPFSVKVVIKNNNTVATEAIDAYLTFGIGSNTGEPIGLGDLSKYIFTPIPALQPSESMSFNFDNLMYVRDSDFENSLRISASVNVHNDLGVYGGGTENAVQFEIVGFSSEKAALEFKKEWRK